MKILPKQAGILWSLEAILEFDTSKRLKSKVGHELRSTFPAQVQATLVRKVAARNTSQKNREHHPEKQGGKLRRSVTAGSEATPATRTPFPNLGRDHTGHQNS